MAKKNYISIGIVGILIAVIVSIPLRNRERRVHTYRKIPTENVGVALNYHYIREKTFWNVMLEKLTADNELTKYTVYTDEFERQIEMLIEEGAYFATLEEVEQFRETGNYPEKCVWICFDDGDESVYKNAFPILKEKQIPFTMFIIAGHVGSEDFNNLKLSTWDELREMRDSGLVSFGSHTYDMHYLEGEAAVFFDEEMSDEFYADIVKSKEVMERELEIPITSIAYPFGHASDEIVEKVKQAGFNSGFILAPHPLSGTNDAYYQNRYLIHKGNFDKVITPWFDEISGNKANTATK